MISFELLKKYFKLLKHNNFIFLFVLLISLILSLLSGVGDPLFLKFLVDSITQKRVSFFIIFSILLLFLSAIIRFFAFIASIYTQKLKTNIFLLLSLRLLEKYYKIPYSKIINQEKGYSLSMIYEEPLKISNSVEIIVDLFRTMLIFSGSIIVCLFLSWKITIIISIIVPPLVYLASKFGSKISKTTEQESEEEAKMRESLVRAIESFKNVNIFNLYERVKEKISISFKNYLNLVYTRVRFSSAFQSTSSLFLSYAEITVLIGAGIEVLNNRMTIGSLFAFMSGYWRVINSFRDLIEIVPSFAKLNGHIKKLEEFESLSNLGKLSFDYDHIELKNSDFRYGNNQIFRKFNLSIKNGEKILIVGPNGSGKTTLMHIICGFLDAEGEVKLPKLERISALLPSAGFIPGSLKDNINYENLTPQKRALFNKLTKELNLYNKIENDPLLLSEGEKKKFHIIMTLMKEADFYIFDEPLANVDVDSKDKIMNIIFELTKNKTLLIVLHDNEKFKNNFEKESTILNYD